MIVIASLLAVCSFCCWCPAVPAHAESGIASVYGYSGGKAAADRQRRARQPTRPDGRPSHAAVRQPRSQVTNKRNGKRVTVRINDRGPFVRGRVIDVTPAAARRWLWLVRVLDARPTCPD